MNDFNKDPEFGTVQPEPEIKETETLQEVSERPTAPVTADPIEPAFESAPLPEAQSAPDLPPETPPEFSPAAPAETVSAPYRTEPSAAPTQQSIPQSPYFSYTSPYPPQGNMHTQTDDPTVAFASAYQQPKSKMPAGLKALIICMCVLFSMTVLGFVGYCAFSFVTNVISFEQSIVDKVTPPEISEPDNSHRNPNEGENSESPEDKDESSETPEDKNNDDEENSAEQNKVVIPNIDVAPNKDGIRLNGVPNTEELDITEVYDKVIRSTVLVLVTAANGSGSGTGIVATEDGYIITNSHVVLNSRNVAVQVKMHDGTTHDAVVVGFDKTTDLAVLKMEGMGYTPAEFADSDTLRMGQWVIAIGNPGGEQFSGSITRGVVSGLDRTVGSYSSNGMTYIQTDAAINPGNSGGPLVNLYGQVVGINSAKIVSDEYEGMGFAIPVTGAKKIIDDLLSGGYVEGRVRFGIKGTQISQMQAYMSGVPQGFMISQINEDSCFVGTDVQPYDIIIAIDGEETPTLDALSNALLNYAPGDTAKITLFRPDESGTGGEEFEVEVTLIADHGETQN